MSIIRANVCADQVFICEINWLNIANELCIIVAIYLIYYVYSKVKCDCVIIIIGYYYYFLYRCDAKKENLCWHKTILLNNEEVSAVFFFMVCVLFLVDECIMFFILYNRESSLIFHVY